MKKIILSVLAIALTVGVVSGTAYALFFDTVQVSGITLATGNADLQVAKASGLLGLTQGTYGDSMDFGGTFEDDKMFPGWGTTLPKCALFWLKNNSDSPISLNLTAQLPDGGVTEDVLGSWNALKDVVEIGLDDTLIGPPIVWNTLAQWNSSASSFDGNLIKGVPKMMNICVRVPTSAGNEIAGKKLSNVTFNITGTQVVTP